MGSPIRIQTFPFLHRTNADSASVIVQGKQEFWMEGCFEHEISVRFRKDMCSKKDKAVHRIVVPFVNAKPPEDHGRDIRPLFQVSGHSES